MIANSTPAVLALKNATRTIPIVFVNVTDPVGMEMIDSRNQTTHTYNQEVVTKIVSAVRHTYFAEFAQLKSGMEVFKKEQE